MFKNTTNLTTILFISCLAFCKIASAIPPPIQLANIYHPDINLNEYLVSEKLDGVRAYWDGKQLISKEGKIFNPPKWFIADFPNQPIEGELWIDRNQFDLVSGIVRQKEPNDDWKKIHLMVFDLPQNPKIFTDRIKIAENLIKESNSIYLKIIPQFEIKNHQELMGLLDKITQEGGEGLILHRKNSLYKALRNNDLLKVKKFYDEEAKIIGYLKGEGKYQGMVGALLVENEEGFQFKIGGGLNDVLRKNPPAIGTIITYKYFSKTKSGKPRFPSFIRVRDDYNFQSKN